MVQNKTGSVLLLILLFALLSVLDCLAGAYPSLQKTYEISGNDVPLEIIQTADGGYLIAGYSGTLSNHARLLFDFSLIKLDRDLNRHWNTIFPFEDVGSFKAAHIFETPQGDFIIAGTRYLNYGRKHNACIMKLNSQGDILWNNSYGEGYSSELVSVSSLGADTFLAFGREYLETEKQLFLWLFSIDGNGQLLDQSFFMSGRPEPKAMLRTTDGGYILIANTMTPSFKFSVPVFKYDANLEQLWSTELEFDLSAQAVETENGYVFAGDGKDSRRLYIVSLSGAGEILWEQSYGQPVAVKFISIAAFCSKEFYVFSAVYNSVPTKEAPFSHLWLFRMNKKGEITWEHKMDFSEVYLNSKIIACPNNEIIILHQAKQGNEGDFGVLKIRAE